jgi:nucleotide-binding universal stress UspA family protein
MNAQVPPAGQEHLLVVGDDGSPGADVAWLWVCNHRWPGWRAEVLTATPPPIPPSRDIVSEPHEWDSPHPRLLVAQSELVSVRHLVDATDPRVLLSAPRPADLLVVGPRGVGRVRALLVGSTTEWLLHHPPAPTAIIRSATPVRRVLACVDGSAHAQAAVSAFCRLPWAVDTAVTVLGVYDGWSAADAGQAAAMKTLAASGVRASTLDVWGKATHAILGHVDEIDPQLIVLGTRGLSAWRPLRLGSTASAVVRAAGCSALVACAPDEPAEARGG